MSAPTIVEELSTDTRGVSLRYLCLYRLVLASALGIFIFAGRLSEVAPHVAIPVVVGYWFLAVAFLLWQPTDDVGRTRVLALQIAVDILALTVLMHADGGYRSGMPFVMMTFIAAAGLVGQGRLVLAFAAFATIAALVQQGWEFAADGARAVDFSRMGLVGLGYFVVAWVSRLLARRALASEVLARARGHALRRAQRINARIIEDMQEGVIVVDDSGRVLQVNPGASQLLGVVVETGGHLSDASRALSRHVFVDGVSGSETFVAEGSGKQLRLRKVRASQGSDLILYLEDQDLVQAQARQIKLAALGRLTANIAHEIRNPLSAVTHAAELLLDEKRSEMQGRLVRIVRDNSDRIEQIVRNVLDLGRRDRASTERLELAAFVAVFVEEYGMQHPERARLLAVEVPTGVYLRFDRIHLHQILVNLVDNACRHCAGNDGAVQLRVRLVEEWIELSIRDDGAGISADDRAKLFEPFFTTNPKGTGLGLYIARELADANAARLVLADSESGTEFRLIARSAG